VGQTSCRTGVSVLKESMSIYCLVRPHPDPLPQEREQRSSTFLKDPRLARLHGLGWASLRLRVALANNADNDSPSPWYAFSGVRPSSGAETPANEANSEMSDTLERAEVAAAEDGRTPVNRYSPWGAGRPVLRSSTATEDGGAGGSVDRSPTRFGGP